MPTVTGNFKWYNSGAAKVAADQIALLTDDIKIILVTSTYVFNAIHQYYTDITNELPTAGGYTLGGQSLASKTLTATSGVSIFSSLNPSWSLTASITARSWVLYDNTPATNKPLICGGSLNYNSGTPLDVTSSTAINIILGTDGWFKFTPINNP